MTKQDITAINQLLATPKKIVIVSHKNPDGDAIGSSLALFHYLTKTNHLATVIVPNDYPDFLKWIPGQDLILKYDSQKEDSEQKIAEADIIFTLDFNAFHRAGDMVNVLANSQALKIMIDHHQQPDDYAKYTYSDVTMSSTCEMIYNFIEYLDGLPVIDSNIATAIYVGIMTDTGSFRFRSTTSATHRIIANLIDKGADNTFIHNQVFDTNSYNRLQLLGCALSNLKVIPESRAAFITLSQKELQQFDYKKGDTEGFVNYALSLNNVVLAAIFIEDLQQGIIKISLRSKGDFSVNEMSRAHFQGGGHTNAAGGKSDVDIAKTVEKFISILPQYNTALHEA
ncbi:bifunctional oligoribonuclease/PAP phosphatase NrnA [Olleya aquimaris]|uniref:Bifunctional oligoribonuclease/PAP phosphatase NrnA n=1 Tax=Olleya sediminilitoris TaxID=2795739 RepID=A0ABS1WPD9_9FLAO|nr:bifunctional oligoribonuclease/PAP phosphatase NrnA [Olleya sediminilitoris]AXO79951.1 bifunctional oligoribonuclease/PAP phosphatase NrnA [Olleya aquimaris]MBL7560975.1 bifunctional oligoribonuclease/PAP phosphatase NrnA [Olleya sediminilitoris]